MNRPIRYLIYFLIGVGLYYAVGAEDNPETLEKFHQIAPFAIIGIAVLLFAMRYIKEKRDRRN